jgi:RNA recognition motif-containing protein
MNLYISNLGYHTTESDLKKMFEQYGAVSSAKIITDRETGRSRGFGFVEMSSSDDAQSAIKNLNGHEMEGRQISVSVAREREDSNRRRF